MRGFLNKKVIFVFLAVIVTVFFIDFGVELTPASLTGVIEPAVEKPAVEILNNDLNHDLNNNTPIVEAVVQILLEDRLDDIAEKLDIIAQQVSEIQDQNKETEELKEEPDEEKEDEDKEKDEEKLKEEVADEQKIVYPTVLIYETKVSPIEQRYIKLFNPNNFVVDLTGWYLQRKTETGSSFNSCVSSSNFEGKVILPNDYFLISRGFNQAGVTLENLTLTENNTLILKNPKGEVTDTAYTASESVSAPGGGGGEPAEITYPKILISEVQVSPIEQRFVELYNPNDYDVPLTDWYIQRKKDADDSYGTFVSSTNFEGKLISANGYFLISRELEDSGILLSIALNDNDFLALKNPKKDIVQEVNWQNSPAENQSLGRIWDEEAQVYQDFSAQGGPALGWEIQTPTPKFQNITWSEPVLPELESIEITTSPSKTAYFVGEELDISGLEITGHYTDGSLQIEAVGPENISGFDTTSPSNQQILTINIENKITTYSITIEESQNSFEPVFPSIIIYTISESIISTTSPSTSIDLKFSEEVKANVYILDSDGKIVKDLYDSSGVTNPQPKTWDGTDKNGNTVPNGVYTIKVAIINADGNFVEDISRTITVDLAEEE